MIPKPLQDITAEHLQRLVDIRAEEGQTLDFKRDVPGDDLDSKKEFIADVCSFANTKGRDIVTGIEAWSIGNERGSSEHEPDS